MQSSWLVDVLDKNVCHLFHSVIFSFCVKRLMPSLRFELFSSCRVSEPLICKFIRSFLACFVQICFYYVQIVSYSVLRAGGCASHWRFTTLKHSPYCMAVCVYVLVIKMQIPPGSNIVSTQTPLHTQLCKKHQSSRAHQPCALQRLFWNVILWN